MSMRRWVTALVVALIAALTSGLMVVACSDDRGDATSTTRNPASVVTTPTPTTNPEEAKVLAAYRGFWSALERAAATNAQEDLAKIRQFATGDQLRASASLLISNIREGVVARGHVQLNPTVTSVDEKRATIRDCQDSSTWRKHDAKTGKQVGRYVPRNDLVIVTVVREAGRWKVSHTRGREGAC
jgi:hypothetical protein